jgi:L-methionine (R)-S-oxide reductase
MSNLIVKQLQSLIEGERNFIANASNFSALIFDKWDNLNWVGFYMFDGKELLLSTFQGKPACIRIPISKGVCGTAFAENRILIVDDVHKFEGHIACDSASNSEIVLPMNYQGKTIGVLDIDSPEFSRFSSADQEVLEDMLELLIQGSDMENILGYYQ